MASCAGLLKRLLLTAVPGYRLHERLVFVHIPKCGGTSVQEAIRLRYSLWSRIQGKARSVAIDAAASLRGAGVVGEPPALYDEKLLVYHLCCPRNSFVTGHFRLTDRVWREFADSWSFVTILRDPVDRWFSEYFYNRYKPEEHLRIGSALASFLETDRAREMGSVYVQYLTGAEPAAATSPEAVQRAVERLGGLDVVGRLEDIDGLVARFHERFGIRLRIPHRRANPLPAAGQRAQIAPELRQRVERICRPDLAVYAGLRSLR